MRGGEGRGIGSMDIQDTKVANGASLVSTPQLPE